MILQKQLSISLILQNGISTRARALCPYPGVSRFKDEGTDFQRVAR